MHQVLKQRPALSASQPSSRRRRRAARAPAIVRHLVMPGLEVARAAARPRETVTAFLRRTGWATHDRKYGWQFRKGLPTILEIDGEAVLRRDWRRSRARVDEISKKARLDERGIDRAIPRPPHAAADPCRPRGARAPPRGGGPRRSTDHTTVNR